MILGPHAVPTHVNSVKTLALVDSGACRSCVSIDFVNRLHMQEISLLGLRVMPVVYLNSTL